MERRCDEEMKLWMGERGSPPREVGKQTNKERREVQKEEGQGQAHARAFFLQCVLSKLQTNQNKFRPGARQTRNFWGPTAATKLYLKLELKLDWAR